MTVFHALLLGVVEGISEFLPISSTGHLILVSHVLQLPQTNFLKSFEVIIQLGAILAVIVLYFKSLWNVSMIKKLLVAFIPTALVGFLLYRFIKTYLIGNVFVVLGALVGGGIALIIFEMLYKKKNMAAEASEEITYKNAFIIGLFQSIAIIPGVSRSAATIVGGLSLGLSRETIVRFSFLLAVPTMIAATGLDLIKNIDTFTKNNIPLLLIGFIVSFLVALLAITWLLRYVRSHSFTAFGWYRIVISIIFFFIFIY